MHYGMAIILFCVSKGEISGEPDVFNELDGVELGITVSVTGMSGILSGWQQCNRILVRHNKFLCVAKGSHQ